MLPAALCADRKPTAADPGGTLFETVAEILDTALQASLGVSLDGLSPRRRGTLPVWHRECRHQRIIPAWAGNASPEPLPVTTSAGHPRASGERIDQDAERPHFAGSSPRERGTRGGRSLRGRPLRIIPARAGNAKVNESAKGDRPDHPRASGERRSNWSTCISRSGSSPRERGTRAARAFRFSHCRIIPARAGNAGKGDVFLEIGPDHPRASGERVTAGLLDQNGVGSSPRERGTREPAHAKSHRRRIIPARAGNAASPARTCPSKSDHPRASGERTLRGKASCISTGSSPRERGTRRLRFEDR